MTLLFVDSFDHYASAEMNQKGYTTNAGPIEHTIVPAGGRRGTQCLSSEVGISKQGLVLQKAILDSDTVVIGCAINIIDFHGQTQIELNDAVGNSLLLFETTAAGEIQLVSGGQTRTTSAAIYTPGTYSHYEIKYTKGTGSNGFAEIRKAGVPLLTITNSTETAQGSEFEMLETFVLQGYSLIDDLYVLNGLGSVNNDYLGDVRVDVHYADADGADTDFIPFTAGTNFAMVDETLTDGDTSFVDAGTINARDVMGMDSASLATQIHGVQQVVNNRKTDAGTVTVDIISEKPAGSGEKVNANAQNVTDNYQMTTAILEDDQDDNVIWTDARINATEFGYKIDNITT